MARIAKSKKTTSGTASPTSKAPAAGSSKARKRPEAAAAKEPKGSAPREGSPDVFGPEERTLVAKLSERTGLLPREVLERALAAYAAAVAPALDPRAGRPKVDASEASAGGLLFLSVDGQKEIAVREPEFVMGSGPDCDLRLQLPLISARHARVLRRENGFVFEDLKSARGSYWRGERVDVRALQQGDEIDLGGFLPVRFRLG